MTVFLTVFTGVVTYVLGQILLKWFIDPVHEMKRTIAEISYTLINYQNIISNPGVAEKTILDNASLHLRELSSQLHAHLYIVPSYNKINTVSGLPSKDAVLSASIELMKLSNSVFKSTDKIYEINAKTVEKICDSLKIYFPDDKRWQKD